MFLCWDMSKKAVHRFEYLARKRKDQLNKHAVTNYGAKVQYTAALDTLDLLNKEGKTFIQQVVGTLLFYDRAVNGIMLLALSTMR